VAEVAGAGANAGDALQAYNPTHYGYQQLREKLIELRTQRASAPASDGLYAAATGTVTQSDVLPPASKSKRRRAAGLAKASTSRIEAEIIANMERWRWLPRDLGEERVEVNIPDFELAVVRNGEVTHRTRHRRQRGDPTRSSNALRLSSIRIERAAVDPEQGDAAEGEWRRRHRGERLTCPIAAAARMRAARRTQRVGRIKFMRPNDFVHCTIRRRATCCRLAFAFSHGCMRVDALAFAGPCSASAAAGLCRTWLIGGSERYIIWPLLSIHIEYFTACR
jgi:hypothetical protein